jgi:valyl-tRNA synthetase
LADLEVEHEEIDGHLYHIRYPFTDGSGGLVVATTRPETMLGDTAVAVNPSDERYSHLTQSSVVLPLMEREIPIIRDDYVDMAFGTGALKVTPAHDPNDFEIGNRHDLPRVKVIGDDGRMTDASGRFEGQDRFECRKAVVEALEADGQLLRIEPIRHGVGHCYRCKTVIEPNLSKQWFIKVKPLAEKAIEAVESGATRIIPDMWTQTYFEWMLHIRDWCISRQIWWGHQIPAWTCSGRGHVVVAMEVPVGCPECAGKELLQESDVLDTWFSSALWPFSTMGWPEQTPLLKTFYPTATLVTGFDILFFWVARMMMMGLHFMGDVPFRDVYVHALVRDEHGKKMSKSKGNVIDPLSVIDTYGTDSFRITLAAFAAQGRDIKMSEKRVEGYRHFVNKLWNAARFSLMHLDKPEMLGDDDTLSVPDRWVLSRLRQVTDSVGDALDHYRFNEAAAVLYQFVWHEFCDWYLEASKSTLYGAEGDDRQQSAKAVLWRVLRDCLVLLHPFIPFVTEEIWSKLPGTEGSIMRAVFPADDQTLHPLANDPIAEKAMTRLVDVVTGIRNIRGEMNLPPALKLEARVQSDDADLRRTVDSNGDLVKTLARLDRLAVEPVGDKPKASATAIVDGAMLFVPLEGVIDLDQEAQRLNKEIGKVDAELAKISKKLGNGQFVSKAPADVVAKVEDQHRRLTEKRDRLDANLQKIVALSGTSGT